MTTDLRAQLQTTLGRGYTLEGELGGGGMSRVFVAEETALHRRVVVKVLPPELAGLVAVDRFKREIALAAQLQHPHIVPLLIAGETEGLPYFTMPFISGESLRARLAKHGELPVSEAMRMLREVASALAFAHDAGVVHRDIKPDNILIAGGAAMVTDFGVAKALSASSTGAGSRLTSAGVALGTPAYMAPEQASGDPLTDHRADIYSWGVLAYELLCGTTPFGNRPPQSMLAAQIVESPDHVTRRRPGVPPVLAALVMRCLEKRAADRPQRAGELMHALDEGMTPSDGSALLPPPVPGSPGLSAARKRQLLRTIGAAAVVVLAAALVTRFIGLKSTGRDASLATDSKAIAVLPFVNVGGDNTNEAYAEGVTDDIRAALTKIGLHPVARGSAFFFKGKSIDPAEVGRMLHVGSFVEGTFQRSGTALKLSVELIDVASGTAKWSETYTGTTQDIFGVQRAIAEAVAGALKVVIAAGARRELAAVGTTNLEAHDLYHQGVFFAHRAGGPDLRKALGLFEEAIAKDSSFAGPWAGLSLVWSSLADNWLPPREAYPKARAAALRAIALDSTDADAHAQLGFVLYWYDWNFRRADDEFKAAIARDARTLYGHLGRVYTLGFWGGDFEAGVRESRLAIIADPLSGLAWGLHADMLVNLEKLDSAETAFANVRALDPASDGLAIDFSWLRSEQHRYDEALQLLQRGDSSNGWIKTRMALLLARMGNTEEARRLLTTLAAERHTRYVPADGIALGYAALGDRNEAFRWLERAFEERSAGLTNVFYPKVWDDLRDDPRFKALQRRVSASPSP